MSFFLARWYRWLCSCRHVDTHGQSSRLKASSTNDSCMANNPTYIAYHVKDTNAGENGEKRGGVWTRIGAAWVNKDGKGFNLVLDVMPLDGRVTLREPSEREHAGSMQSSEIL